MEQTRLFQYYCIAHKKLRKEGCSMYIISYSYTLENLKEEYELKIELSVEMSAFFRESVLEHQLSTLQDRIY